MTGILDQSFFAHVPHRQDRIRGISLIGAERRPASRDGSAVIHLRAAFRNQEIVPVSDVIDVRRFR